jgi:ADP-heptose:LPS heptosyltransferase
VDDARAAALIGDGPVIALGPTANWDGKIWPAERFAELFQALQANNIRAAIFAGPGEAEGARAAPLLAALPGALHFIGNLTLPEVAACLKRCTLFIGNDSGLMHLAAATGIPTLGLFGRSRAAEYAPAGARAAFIAAPGPPGEAPMEGLTVASVLHAAQKLLCA